MSIDQMLMTALEEHIELRIFPTISITSGKRNYYIVAWDCIAEENIVAMETAEL